MVFFVQGARFDVGPGREGLQSSHLSLEGVNACLELPDQGALVFDKSLLLLVEGALLLIEGSLLLEQGEQYLDQRGLLGFGDGRYRR